MMAMSLSAKLNARQEINHMDILILYPSVIDILISYFSPWRDLNMYLPVLLVLNCFFQTCVHQRAFAQGFIHCGGPRLPNFDYSHFYFFLITFSLSFSLTKCLNKRLPIVFS